MEIQDIIKDFGGMKLYQNSVGQCGPTRFFMAKGDGGKMLFAFGGGPLHDALCGEAREGCKACPVSHENRLVLNRFLGYTNPVAFGRQTATVGLGDRLGLAAPGHIRAIKGRGVKPVLAQQSIRELDLTGRTYEDVLDAVCFAVIQEGYTGGFGADGDHLKQEADIAMSLRLGFSMITLDCSEKIDTGVQGLAPEELAGRYAALPAGVREGFEGAYLGKSFDIAGRAVNFDKKCLMENVLTYIGALDFIEKVYSEYIKPAGREIDFEISIDEGTLPTSYEAHYLLASELEAHNIPVCSMAPRFVGEFQKGIDYIGSLPAFEEDIRLHAAIADRFGYKVSIHSGSDKFSVFPLIGRYTGGRFHLKTAGTNWLEAVRLVALKKPTLYRAMHAYALAHFEEARKYYHVTTDISAIRPLGQVSDGGLPGYMDDSNARQLLHITYGLLLTARDKDGRPLFRDAFYAALNEYEDEYAQALIAHIGRHLDLIGKPVL
jgi:hypothetical protein